MTLLVTHMGQLVAACCFSISLSWGLISWILHLAPLIQFQWRFSPHCLVCESQFYFNHFSVTFEDVIFFLNFLFVTSHHIFKQLSLMERQNTIPVNVRGWASTSINKLLRVTICLNFLVCRLFCRKHSLCHSLLSTHLQGVAHISSTKQLWDSNSACPVAPDNRGGHFHAGQRRNQERLSETVC